MRKFEGVDFYQLDELLSEDERMIRDTTREWVSDNVVPIIAEYCREGTFPRKLISQMGELGVFGANLSGYGCAGVGPVAYGLMMQELERGDSGVRSCASVQGSLVMFPI
ncbi:MAG: acyl-CoA dehydrogenase, partial [Planctomycetes bacterium]|nr:acyl-CoA dehydrogenase [Planctomycetota bacterium]